MREYVVSRFLYYQLTRPVSAIRKVLDPPNFCFEQCAVLRRPFAIPGGPQAVSHVAFVFLRVLVNTFTSRRDFTAGQILVWNTLSRLQSLPLENTFSIALPRK